MTKRPSNFRETDAKRIRGFKQCEVTRVIKGFEKSGMKVGRVEVSREGKIIVFPDNGSAKNETETDNLKDLV
jgi:hypothetical protein